MEEEEEKFSEKLGRVVGIGVAAPYIGFTTPIKYVVARVQGKDHIETVNKIKESEKKILTSLKK